MTRGPPSQSGPPGDKTSRGMSSLSGKDVPRGLSRLRGAAGSGSRGGRTAFAAIDAKSGIRTGHACEACGRRPGATAAVRDKPWRGSFKRTTIGRGAGCREGAALVAKSGGSTARGGSSGGPRASVRSIVRRSSNPMRGGRAGLPWSGTGRSRRALKREPEPHECLARLGPRTPGPVGSLEGRSGACHRVARTF